MPPRKNKEMRLRLKARVASQALQGQLVSRARKMAENPDVVLPVCGHGEVEMCRGCPVTGLRRRLENIQKVKDYETRLDRKARWGGDDLTKAYAGTLMLRLKGKAPYLSEYSLRTPAGVEKVPFAKRGKARDAVLAGLQNYHHPRYRILAYQGYIKKGYILYSHGDRLVCSGRSPRPPPGFVDFTVRRLPYDMLPKGEGIYVCPHEKGARLTVHWRSPDVRLEICDSCVLPKHRLIASLTERIGAKDPGSDFDAAIRLDITCRGERCSLEREHVPQRDILLDFLEAKITDRQFMEFAREDALKKNLQELGGRKIYVAGNVCYEDDVRQFVLSFGPNDEERLALFSLAKGVEAPLITRATSALKVIEENWDEHGMLMLERVARNRRIAREIWESGLDPGDALHQAMTRGRFAEVLSDLPEYMDLPEVASFCDRLARTFKTEGGKGAVRYIGAYRGHNVKIKAISYAALLHLGEAKGKEWKFAEEEVEFADYLRDFVGELFRSTGERYHRALQNLLTASGSGERVVLQK